MLKKSMKWIFLFAIFLILYFLFSYFSEERKKSGNKKLIPDNFKIERLIYYNDIFICNVYIYKVKKYDASVFNKSKYQNIDTNKNARNLVSPLEIQKQKKRDHKYGIDFQNGAKCIYDTDLQKDYQKIILQNNNIIFKANVKGRFLYNPQYQYLIFQPHEY